MKTLLLLRHAKSSWSSLDLPDFERPLNKRGMKDAPEMGKRLHRRDIHPDLILCSPAERARSTWQEVSSNLQLENSALWNVQYEQSIYEARAQTLLNLVQSQSDDFKEILLIGHNPGIEQFANELSPDPIGHMATCALVHLKFDTQKWATITTAVPQLVYYDYPKKKI